MKRRLPGLLFALAASCVSQQPTQLRPDFVAPSEFVQLRESLAPYYTVFRPPGRGPFPTLVLVSGCSGFEHPRAPTHYLRFVERFRSEGWAVIFADYVRARGVREACRGVMNPQEVGLYVLAALADVRELPFVDPASVNVIGWSLGGGGVLAALEMLPPGKRQLRSAVALYPDCSDLRPWRAAIPAFVVLAANDTIQPPERCQHLFALEAADTEVRVYSNSHHGFDMSELPTRITPTLPPLAYNEATAAAAWSDISNFLNAAER